MADVELRRRKNLDEILIPSRPAVLDWTAERARNARKEKHMDTKQNLLKQALDSLARIKQRQAEEMRSLEQTFSVLIGQDITTPERSTREKQLAAVLREFVALRDIPGELYQRAEALLEDDATLPEPEPLGVCPDCGSDDISGGSWDCVDGLSWQDVHCQNCQREWKEVYAFTRLEETDGTPFQKDKKDPYSWNDVVVIKPESEVAS